MTTSNSANSILARVAKRNNGQTLTIEILSEWLSSRQCPAHTSAAAAWSILELATSVGEWSKSKLVQVMRERHYSTSEAPPEGMPNDGDNTFSADTLVPCRESATTAETFLFPYDERALVKFSGQMVSSSGKLTGVQESFSLALRISDMLEFWNGLPTDERPRDGFPLEILYLAWAKRPTLVSPNTRSSGRIIPSKLAHVSPGDRQAGKLFTMAAHVANLAPETGTAQSQMVFTGLQQQEVARQQFVLPGFKESTTIGPCLPLALYDLGDAPATSRGPAAPLPLRLFVEAVLAVPMDSRDTHTPVAMRVTLRQMLDWLYPSPRKPRPNEYWPRLMAAFEALDSPAARIPWYDPETGQGGLRRIVNISDIPRGAAKLDDLGSVVKRVCSRSSLPGVGRRPSMMPSFWRNGSPPRATA